MQGVQFKDVEVAATLDISYSKSYNDKQNKTSLMRMSFIFHFARFWK
jgi:hypothetical protein